MIERTGDAAAEAMASSNRDIQHVAEAELLAAQRGIVAALEEPRILVLLDAGGVTVERWYR